MMELREKLKSLHCFLILSTLVLLASANNTGKISGKVTGDNGPIAGALVRIQATETYTLTNKEGYFTLAKLSANDLPIYVTAWSSGYYINGVKASFEEEIEIHLEAHADFDNPNYAWLSSTSQSVQNEDQGCAKCHSSANTDFPFTLPFDEWLKDAHSQSAFNPRFITMYNGTDIEGNRSPPTRYGYNREYGSFPLRSDNSSLYYGPGYKLDFPETNGNCAACHTPLASVNDPYGVNPTTLDGINKEGVSCDFCHKIWDVRLDPASGLPYDNMPGVLSYIFRRPPDGYQFFAGPLDDVAPGEDTYSPIQTESKFCAPCHYSEFWGTPIYNSFGEWLESPYSNPETEQTCQDCHMPHLGANKFATTEAGGIERNASTIFSHKMPGADDENLLQNAVTMNVESLREENKVFVNVEIINDKTGHHVPTDSPLRHLVLLVQVTDENGGKLKQIEGPFVPEWGGIGNPDEGYYAGLAGKGFAKILMELWTEITPSGAYWNPTRIISDNRIPAMGSDKSTYVFQTSEVSDTFEVWVKLVFRRAFIKLIDQKGWDNADILMEEKKFNLQ
ncbi:MAG: hypothetical protein GWP19_00135 [Planctomycetia bacterium]|nr:hypothetical protein [Planctomycetia bacterium]